MPRRRYTHCVITGCLAQGSREWVEGVHQKRVHYLCACGWVGVSYNQHVAQCRRAGIVAEHAVIGTSRYRPPTSQREGPSTVPTPPEDDPTEATIEMIRARSASRVADLESALAAERAQHRAETDTARGLADRWRSAAAEATQLATELNTGRTAGASRIAADIIARNPFPWENPD